MAAEMPLGRAFLAVDRRVPDADRTAALDLQRVGLAHDVDRITAAAGALAADRAIAALVGVGGVAVEREADRAAAARAFETDRHGISFSARVNLPKAAAASAKRTVCGRADNPGSRT